MTPDRSTALAASERRPLEVSASAVAARLLGYGGLAGLIADRQLVPGAIVRLFWRNSIAKDGESLAVIVLAGSTARWCNCQDGWDGEERLLALDAVHANAKAFQKAARHAGLIVRENWPEIVREAQPRGAGNILQLSSRRRKGDWSSAARRRCC